MQLSKKIKFIDENETDLLKRLIDFLKIQSISTDKSFSEDCKNAANWLVRELKFVGFEA